jgi:hypothetical protein
MNKVFRLFEVSSETQLQNDLVQDFFYPKVTFDQLNEKLFRNIKKRKTLTLINDKLLEV